MPALTTRERTEVSAALICLHHNGLNAAAAEATAKAAIRNGRSPADAYKAAVGAAIAGRPDVAKRIQRIGAQLDASDDGTVASYDVALRGYIDTGNPAHLARVEKMAMQDAVELAIQNGEVSREDVAAGRADWSSIGLTAEGVAAAYSDAPAPAPVACSPIPVPPGQPGSTPAAGNPAGWSATGYSSARAKPEWQNALVVTGSRSPYEGMDAGQMRAAMRGDVPDAGAN